MDYENEQISLLKNQLVVAERKVANAKHLSEAHEKLARESQEREHRSNTTAESFRQKLGKTLEKLNALEQEQKGKDLRNCCAKNENEMLVLEKIIRELRYDPNLHLPINCNRRRKLQVTDKKFRELRLKHQSQCKLLESLIGRQSLDLDMRKAAVTGDLERVNQLLAKGVSVNIADETGFSAFKYACGHGHVAVVKAMINASDVNDSDGNSTPMYLALEGSHKDVVQILLEQNASISENDETGRSPLHVACQNNSLCCVTLLVDGGADLNAIDGLGCTCLHYCAMHNYEEVASFLLEKGAKTNIVNIDGFTPLTLAKSKRNKEVIQLLSFDTNRK